MMLNGIFMFSLLINVEFDNFGSTAFFYSKKKYQTQQTWGVGGRGRLFSEFSESLLGGSFGAVLFFDRVMVALSNSSKSVFATSLSFPFTCIGTFSVIVVLEFRLCSVFWFVFAIEPSPFISFSFDWYSYMKMLKKYEGVFFNSNLVTVQQDRSSL